ncbi:hypothetical protein sscle_11g085750 [Sclerotinia sclerotiorum 1980 UF-70]|uniref:Uncharacterized protein n=1 Tax=Sclerotinia sclerotiorum (strain ATCC 18683 / 1980 / Ss-1) TaxID=665079 RepID=A0A1D9QFV1_SCLS1|nr:hypothetical protein sscle_11g085750 [Sclerotinia sclerotiorum 1980 UF-70]
MSNQNYQNNPNSQNDRTPRSSTYEDDNALKSAFQNARQGMQATGTPSDSSHRSHTHYNHCFPQGSLTKNRDQQKQSIKSFCAPRTSGKNPKGIHEPKNGQNSSPAQQASGSSGAAASTGGASTNSNIKLQNPKTTAWDSQNHQNGGTSNVIRRQGS